MRGGSRRGGFYSAGGKVQQDDDLGPDREPRFDKNPFYRTMDIFNGVFDKNIKLSVGKTNCTDLKTIYVNFGEFKPSKLKTHLRVGMDNQHAIYMLDCGHEWEGRITNKDGSAKTIGKDWGMCGVCGADQAYLGFEHEWQHIIFKSDLVARKIFCEQYARYLHSQAPNIDSHEIEQFLSILVNAFDDLRVRSLWSKVYPGSARAIEDRWRWYTYRMGDNVNTDFVAYVFAVAFKVPTNPAGEFEALRPVVEWGVSKVLYKGFANMLIHIRALLDRCMGALLANVQPPPPKLGLQPIQSPSLQPPPPAALDPGGKGQQDGEGKDDGEQDQQDPGPQGPKQKADDHDPNHQTSSTGSPDAKGEDNGGQQAQSGSDQGAPDEEMEEEGDGSGGDDGDEESLPSPGSSSAPTAKDLSKFPSVADLKPTETEQSQALQKLLPKGEFKIDPKEEHKEPEFDAVEEGRKSQAMNALMAKILRTAIKDLAELDTDAPANQVDPDMAAQLDQLVNKVATPTDNSLLTGNSKAHITIIPVTTAGKGDKLIEMGAEERFYIQRMRAAFYKALGRQKAKRGAAGNNIDVQALIQYRLDHQDPDVFELNDMSRGFAYSVLSDMSGSMHGTFPIVCAANEMLKEALDFPFVVGTLWGFRGGEDITGRIGGRSGEVWMYQYARDVNWYTGVTPFKVHNHFNGTIQVPVKCGGITPMNSAINVAATHLWRKMPAGMAKRLFILTDGSPIQTKVSGAHIPERMLRRFVTKQIQEARKHGVQVFTIIIGEHAIDEDKCLQMFGPRQFWRRVGRERVGSVLSNLVLANFSKYIKMRG